MIPLLMTLWRYKNLLALGSIALALASLGVSLFLQSKRLDAAIMARTAAEQMSAQWRTSFEAMEATNSANVAALEKLQAEAKRIEQAAEESRLANANLAGQIEIIRRRVLHVAPSDDRPVSILLCNTLNELRRLQGDSDPACSN